MTNTEAYVVWRNQSQQMLDFAVLVTTATPQLKHALKEHATNPSIYLAKNPAFRASNEPYSTERRAIPKHKSVLGASLFFSLFSYFETYFFTVIDEIIDFHGGLEDFEPLIRSTIRDCG